MSGPSFNPIDYERNKQKAKQVYERRKPQYALTLEELEERARRYAENRRADQHRRYHLAKELGFSATEAMVLQNRSDALIKGLAGQRKAGKF